MNFLAGVAWADKKAGFGGEVLSGQTVNNQSDNELLGGGSNTLNLAIGAFGGDFEGAATDLAIGGKTLIGDAGIDGHVKRLAAVGTLDGGELFHGTSVGLRSESANQASLNRGEAFDRWKRSPDRQPVTAVFMVRIYRRSQRG